MLAVSKKLKVRPLIGRCPASLACEQVGWGLGPSPRKVEEADQRSMIKEYLKCVNLHQGGITCGAIDEPTKSSKAIDERVIINFCEKNVVIAHFRDKNVYR